MERLNVPEVHPRPDDDRVEGFLLLLRVNRLGGILDLEAIPVPARSEREREAITLTRGLGAVDVGPGAPVRLVIRVDSISEREGVLQAIKPVEVAFPWPLRLVAMEPKVGGPPDILRGAVDRAVRGSARED